MALAPASAASVAADQRPLQAACKLSPPSVVVAVCLTGQLQLALSGFFGSTTLGEP